MSMRPSFRLLLMAPPSPRFSGRLLAYNGLLSQILGRNAVPGKAGLAAPAGVPAARAGHRPAARPGERRELRRQHGGDLGLRGFVHRIEPFDLRLAELARA